MKYQLSLTRSGTVVVLSIQVDHPITGYWSRSFDGHSVANVVFQSLRWYLTHVAQKRQR